jgi:hypothetical protein
MIKCVQAWHMYHWKMLINLVKDDNLDKEEC